MNNDIILFICRFLYDKDKLNFLSSSNKTNMLKNKIIFYRLVHINKIKHLQYFDQFVNIISDDICIFPKNIKQLTFGNTFNKKIKNDTIPSSVTHLTFGDKFDQKVKNRIPHSITHLTFGYYFNRNIKDSIPNSVTHLTLGYCFKKDINNNIPSSVTHLIVNLNNYEKNNIPKSVIFINGEKN
jgi:hypothetical protein